MTQKSLLFAVLAVLVFPQQADAFATAVYRVGGQDYMFRADNIVNPSVVGEPTGFKVKIATVDYAADPSLANAQPVTGLAQQLRLNMRHVERNESLTVILAETEPGLYSIPFVPTTVGQYVYTVATLINGSPINAQFPCSTSGNVPASAQIPPSDLNAQLAEPGNMEILFEEGGIPCPTEGTAELVFPSENGDSGITDPAGGGAIPADLEARLATLESGGGTPFTRLAFYGVTLINLCLSGFLGFMIFRDMY